MQKHNNILHVIPIVYMGITNEKIKKNVYSILFLKHYSYVQYNIENLWNSVLREFTFGKIMSTQLEMISRYSEVTKMLRLSLIQMFFIFLFF